MALREQGCASCWDAAFSRSRERDVISQHHPPVAHSHWWSLSDLIQQQGWKELNLTPSPPHGCSWWAQGCSVLLSHPLPSTKQQQGEKNGVFVGSLGGLVAHVWDWHGHPGTWGFLGAQNFSGLERAGTSCPFLCCHVRVTAQP